MPENFLTYLDDKIVEARASVASALDDSFDYTSALALATRLMTLLQVRVEAGDYEPA